MFRLVNRFQYWGKKTRTQYSSCPLYDLPTGVGYEETEKQTGKKKTKKLCDQNYLFPKRENFEDAVIS